jgi:hypothetical protein
MVHASSHALISMRIPPVLLWQEGSFYRREVTRFCSTGSAFVEARRSVTGASLQESTVAASAQRGTSQQQDGELDTPLSSSAWDEFTERVNARQQDRRAIRTRKLRPAARAPPRRPAERIRAQYITTTIFPGEGSICSTKSAFLRAVRGASVDTLLVGLFEQPNSGAPLLSAVSLTGEF